MHKNHVNYALNVFEYNINAHIDYMLMSNQLEEDVYHALMEDGCSILNLLNKVTPFIQKHDDPSPFISISS